MTKTKKKTLLLCELNEGATKPKYIQNGVMLKAKLSKTPRTTGAKTQARESWAVGGGGEREVKRKLCVRFRGIERTFRETNFRWPQVEL